MKSAIPETISAPSQTIALGDTVRRLDRPETLWRVIGIQAGRAFLSPVMARPEWSSLDDLVRVGGTA